MDTLARREHPPRPNTAGDGLLAHIGDTPLIPLEGIWCKLELLNPSGSIKARLAKALVERAEAEGRLHPGDTIVEATSGNTGNALAMVAAIKGYRMLVVLPRGISSERLAISRAYGAELLEVGDFHVGEALERARELGERRGYFCPRQFTSEVNVEENRDWLGREILAQLPAGRAPDALVVGIGTGGTLIGVGRAFREANPACLTVGVEPAESPTVATGGVAQHRIEGIADGFVPDIIGRHRDEIDELVTVPSDDAVTEMRRIAARHGCFVGPSSGAHLLAAQALRQRRPGLETIVTPLCDCGEKYFSEHFPPA